MVCLGDCRPALRGWRSQMHTVGPPKDPGAMTAGIVEDIVWGFTIADVILENAEIYCADVKRLAESISTDTEELVRSAETTPSKSS